MKLSLRPIIRRSITAAVALGLSLSALAPVGGNVAGAYAASSPTITTTSLSAQYVIVTGSGFGYGDTVYVYLYDRNYAYHGTMAVTTASKPFCSGRYCVRGGLISTDMIVGGYDCSQTDHVIAYDTGPDYPGRSNWSNVGVSCVG
jgi:hypothetical protein